MAKKIEDVRIENSDTTKKIILPKGMDNIEAMNILERAEVQAQKVIVIKDVMKGFICDNAVAFVRALKEIYGIVDGISIPGFFGEMKPQQIAIETAYGVTEFVPFGRFNLPGVSGYVETGISRDKKGRPCFNLVAQIRQKEEPHVRALFDLAKKYAAEKSIYKGQAFRLELSNEFPMPEFLDLSKVDESQLVFNHEVQAAIDTSIFTLIEHTNQCRDNHIPLKRGVLLAGKYGVGKTLTTYVTAKKCVNNGWTFIYCKSADELAEVVELAKQYQPAVVFCEDIDRVINGERSTRMDEVLNIVDGIESKGTELMVILTTNHAEQINRALMRPGRLDAIINVLPPDADSVERLITMYAGKLLSPGTDLTEVSQRMAGNIPAVIREVVERAKLAAIRIMDGEGMLYITDQALHNAAESMTNQLELMASTAEKKPTELDHAVRVLGETLIGDALAKKE